MRRLAEGARRGWSALAEWFNALDLGENGVLLTFAVVIGILGALGVAAFYALIDGAYALFYGAVAGLLPVGAPALHRPVLTAAGIATAWWMMKRLGRGAEGLNIPDVQMSVARRGGIIATRPALARTAASAVTIGAGGSAGSEGPVAVLGATVGSALGQAFRFEPARIRVLVGAGTAAGISAAFNAPLAGAFFALEQILGSLGVSAFPPVLVSSVVAAVVSQSVFGSHPAFGIPLEHGPPLPSEIFLLYPVLGIVAGLMGALFIRTYYGTSDLLHRIPLPATLLPWLGGFLVGAGVLLSGGLLVGRGHVAIPAEAFGGMIWWALLLLALGKILATALTFAAGGSGGVFTPCLYVGAATGGAFGAAAASLFPDLVASPEVYALVGMGAVVVAATNAPLTGILLVFELTNDYAIVPPLMIATVVAYLVARRIERDSLYGVWLRRRGENLEGGADVDMLAALKVKDAYDRDPQVIGEAATVSQLLEHLGHGSQTHFPVVDGQLGLLGMIGVGELGRVARDQTALLDVLLAADVAVPAEPVELDTPLDEVTRKMGQRGMSTLPVHDPETGRLLGIIDRGHVLAVYERRMAGRSDESGAPVRTVDARS
jgi:CIC family chloride channel protein